MVCRRTKRHPQGRLRSGIVGHTEDLLRGVEHPDFPGLRRRVVADLHREIGGIPRPLGHVRKGRLWVRQSLLAVTYLEVQRCRYGFGCFLDVGCEPRLLGLGGPVPSYREGTCCRIGRFTGSAREAGRLDALLYVNLEPGSPLRQEIEQLLRERVLPFLRSCHKPFGRVTGPPPLAD